jgi:hypothetical protein
VDILEDRFDALSAQSEGVKGSPLVDLAATQLANDVGGVRPGRASKESTSPEIEAPSVHVEVDAQGDTEQPQNVVVPVHISIGPDAEEIRLNVRLQIKVNRKPSS